jgi:hypothetical protein
MNIYKVYAAFSGPFRKKRMHAFCLLFGVTTDTRILDVGGYPMNWKLCRFKPLVTIANLDSCSEMLDDGFQAVRADGCRLPFRERSFPIVYSNSVIEHLGCWDRQMLMAQEIRRVGVHYFVQTPNYWFPVEPHYLTPFFQFLSPTLQKRMARCGTVWGLISRPSREQVFSMVEQIALLTEKKMRLLFPEATILREKFCGLTKAIVAYH